MAYYHLGLFVARAREVRAANKLAGPYSFGNDFYQIWQSSRDWLCAHQDPYSDEETRHMQEGVYGRPLDPYRLNDPKDWRGFPYPAFTDLLFWPVAELPFPTVRILVFLLLLGLTVASTLLWIGALGLRLGWLWSAIVVLLVVSSYPVLEGLHAGQVGLVVGFLFAASIVVLQRGKLLLSGVLIALTTIKPQVTILAILYLVIWSVCEWRKRWALCAGLFATSSALVGCALVIWPRWIQAWLHGVVQYHGYSPPPVVGEVLRDLLGSRAGTPGSVAATIGLLTVAVVLIWRNRTVQPGSLEFWFTLSLLLAITAIAVLPGQAVYDHGILLPGTLLLMSRWRDLAENWVLKTILALAAAVLFWPWVAAMGVLVARPLLNHEQFYSKAVFALPLRTAAVFPFVVTGLLALAHRRVRTYETRAVR